jgi:acetyl-CoA carboxylase biotin carboxylase subunit
VDDYVYGGYRVPSAYDSLIAKIIAYGKNRQEAIVRMRRALSETVIAGIRTTIPLHRRILAHEDFVAGRISTRFLERMNIT